MAIGKSFYEEYVVGPDNVEGSIPGISRLANDDILAVYMSPGEIKGVLSSDNGRTWDWERRYILFRGTDHAQHSPQSVLLSDGSILTVVMHPVTYTWGDGETRGNLIGLSNVSIVIWSPSATSI